MDFYHLINRGVEKRDIFLEDGDYLRFIHDMYIFNDASAAPNYVVKERQKDRKRELLVRIHAFTLMPNHYHLLVSPVRGNGMSLFMRKLNMGYAKYFNEKYERSGVLWQGVFRRTLVNRDAHFLYIPYYIHLNPLDLVYPEWRQGKVLRPGTAIERLKTYRWGSHLDYCGIPNFPSVIYKSELASMLGSRAKYEKEIAAIISDPYIATHSDTIEMA